MAMGVVGRENEELRDACPGGERRWGYRRGWWEGKVLDGWFRGGGRGNISDEAVAS